MHVLRFAVASVAAAVASLVLACSHEEARPPYVFDGPSASTPCERAGWRCAPSATACGEGSVSGGHSLGCTGETAVCCLPASDGGTRDGAADADATSARDTGTDAPNDADSGDASDASDGA